MRIAAIVLTAVVFCSCNPKEPAASASMPAPVRSAKTPAAAAPRVATGRVAETMNAAGYTYMRIESDHGDLWAAVPETRVEKGSTVSVSVQMMTENFESTALHRKFDLLAFGTLDGAPSAQMPAAAPPSMVAVEKVQQPVGGKAVADLWKERKALAGKDVVVRGKVVKFLPQIMGRNWMHLRDGSGSEEKKDNDITVTTMDQAKVGDVVTVSGRVAVDKDLGSGYSYVVMIEDAKLKQ
jgi:hypothetical protein